MIKIHVTDREGKTNTVEAPTDMNLNVMEVLKLHEFDVEGTCGGMAMCASCHCYIESDHSLPEKSDEEEDMLDEAFFVDDDKSRLTCQLKVNNDLDQLQVTLAPVG